MGTMVTSDRFPVINQRVFLQAGEGPDAAAVAAVVQDVTGREMVLLCPPALPGGRVLRRGDRVVLNYVRPRGVCRLEGEVVEAFRARRDGGWPGVRLRVLAVDCQQRRRYFRWRAHLPVRYAFVGQGGEGAAGASAAEGGGELLWRDAATVDLSAGGALLRLAEPCAEGDELLVTVRLPEGEVEAMGKVVRCWQEGTDKGAKMYLAGVDFTRLTVWGRQAIMRFVCSQERRLRRWGLS